MKATRFLVVFTATLICLTSCRKPKRPIRAVVQPKQAVKQNVEETTVTHKLTIPPRSTLAQYVDNHWLNHVVMCLAAGTFQESPQQTHFWNNVKLQSRDIDHLDRSLMSPCKGSHGASHRRILKIPVFHIPILGGWRHYMVIKPVGHNDAWHAGWIAGDAVGVSQIPLKGPVRLLLGPGDVTFFGISAEAETLGQQIKLKEVTRGRIGDSGKFCKTPLL